MLDSSIFDDVSPEPESVALGFTLLRQLSDRFGEEPRVLEAAPLFAGNVAHIVGDRVHYFPQARAWFTYIDKPAAAAMVLAVRAQKRLRGCRSVSADQIVLRERTMYVGSSEGKTTRAGE